jgi:hypothetical protein
MGNEVALEQVFLLASALSPALIIILAVLHAHLSPPVKVCGRIHQAASFHVLGFEV